MPSAKRPAFVPAAPPPAVEGVNFGSLKFYMGGFTLPKGRYALEFNVIMHAPTKQDGTPAGKPRLGVMVTAHPLDGGEAIDQFYSMGSKADQSFAPDATTGKSLVAVPGGPSTGAPRLTNWNVFLKSLYDCGLPEGTFTNDISVLDGIWAVTDQIPEPEERKGFGKAATGEADEEVRTDGKIAVVVEIIEGGKPWEGSGGFPTAPPAPAVAAPAKAPLRVAPRTAAPAAPPPVAAATDDDVMTAATSGMTEVLTVPAYANGVSKLILRTGTFKAVNAASGPEMAQAVIDTYFGSDEALNSVLGQLGYAVVGVSVKPA